VTDVEFLRNALDALVSTPSESGNEAPISEVALALGRQAGLDVTLVPVSGRGGTVLGRLERGVGPALLFNGHLDTLPVHEGEADPFAPSLVDDVYRGAEVNNMKAALAAMLTAMSRLADRRWSGSVTLMAAVGECDTLGVGTVAALATGVRADAAINGEPTDLSILLRHAGVVQLRLAAKGIPAHVSQRAQGHNAITDLIRVISGLEDEILTATRAADYPSLPTINVGEIHGGGLPSMLAEDASASIDVRTVPGMTVESVILDIERLVSIVPDVCDVRVEARRPPVFMNPPAFRSDPDSRPVRAVADAHRLVTGRDATMLGGLPHVFFGSDASHLAAAGIPTCIYGPGKAHDINVADETIAWSDVATASDVYEAAALSFLGKP
jgi:acetylornithine deacetylase